MIPDLLRIGMFSESFQPVQNGVTTAVLTLVSGLRRLGHRVRIFAPENEEQQDPEANVLRFPSFVSAFNPDYPLAYPFLPRLALTTHFDRLKLDVIHTHTPFIMGLTGQKLALQRGLPLVSTFHTLYSKYSHYVPLLPDAVTHRLLTHYLPWYYNRCDEIICPSAMARNVLKANGVERPIEIIPTGIPLPSPTLLGPEARQRTRKKLGFTPHTPLLLFAGRLATEKNIGWLLEVFGQVVAHIPEAHLLLAGGGPQAEELQQQAAKLGLGRSVTFLGPLPRRELDALYNAADAFCFPSPTETQGLVVGEARAAGLPCVVIDAGGAPETVCEGQDGFRVCPGDSDQYVARLLHLLQDETLRHSMRFQCLRNARQFTPERMVQRVLNVYERVLIETPSSHRSHHQPEDDPEWDALFDSPALMQP